MLRLLLLTLLITTSANAQARRPSHCLAIAEAAPGLTYLRQASFDTPVPENSVRISYLDHSMFLIQTTGGLKIVTDYNGSNSTEILPDVVTMNQAHPSHYTMFPDPAIAYALRGWGTDDAGAEHYLDLGEMLIRNVPTDTRGRFDTPGQKNGNSIFIFEVAGLCIGHLGHLHFEPTEAQYAAIGRLDVVMAAVDGSFTLPTEAIVRVMKRLKSTVVIPMHWFGRATLDRFVLEMADEFDIQRPGDSAVELSLFTLPRRPTVLVLEPIYEPDLDE